MRFLLPSARKLLFAAVFLVNPAYLTSCADDDGFEFGEEEMKDVLVELESESFEAGAYTFRFELEQSAGQGEVALSQPGNAASFVRSAHACNSRTFVADAHACGSDTEMPVAGRAIVYEGETIVDELEVVGTMWVLGNLLTNATFDLDIESEGYSLITWDDEDDPQFVLRSLLATGVGPDEVTVEAHPEE